MVDVSCEKLGRKVAGGGKVVGNPGGGELGWLPLRCSCSWPVHPQLSGGEDLLHVPATLNEIHFRHALNTMAFIWHIPQSPWVEKYLLWSSQVQIDLKLRSSVVSQGFYQWLQTKKQKMRFLNLLAVYTVQHFTDQRLDSFVLRPELPFPRTHSSCQHCNGNSQLSSQSSCQLAS